MAFLRGGNGADSLVGTIGSDTLAGFYGSDRLNPGRGADRADGGPGAEHAQGAAEVFGVEGCCSALHGVNVSLVQECGEQDFYESFTWTSSAKQGLVFVLGSVFLPCGIRLGGSPQTPAASLV